MVLYICLFYYIVEKGEKISEKDYNENLKGFQTNNTSANNSF